MTAFADFVKQHKLTAEQVVRRSQQLEKRGADDYKLSDKRFAAKKAEKKYADEGIAKPKSGRGVSPKQFEAAVAGAPQSRVVRQKFIRVLADLTKSKLHGKDLFGGVARTNPRKNKQKKSEG